MARGGWWSFSIELSLGEVVAVVGGSLGSAFVIFLLGVWVGKGWEARRMHEEQQLIRMPIEGEASGAGRQGEDRLTFYEELTGSKQPGASKEGTGKGQEKLARKRDQARGRTRTTPRASGKRSQSDVKLGGSGAWSVQVLASREEKTARRLVARLRAAGFGAYMVKLSQDGELRYRVRVGPFPTLERARSAASRLRKRPGITEAFVASN